MATAQPSKASKEPEKDSKNDQEPEWQEPELKDADDKEAQEDKWAEAAEADPEMTPAKSNPLIGAHLESVEGAVDLQRFPGAAESVQEKLDKKDEE